VLFVILLAVLTPLVQPTITGVIYGVVMAMMFTYIQPLQLLVGVSAVLIVAAASLIVQRWLVRRRSRLSITQGSDIDRVASIVTGLGCWSRRSALLAPRATIVKVANDLWQQAVTRLVGCANVVLVDLSESTANLEWELRLLAARSFRHTVFVRNGAAGTPVSLPQHLSTLLYAEGVQGRRERRDFLAALTAALDDQVASASPVDWRDGMVNPALACLRFLALFSVATLGLYWMLVTTLVHLARTFST
jgi:hypothetical protein